MFGDGFAQMSGREDELGDAGGLKRIYDMIKDRPAGHGNEWLGSMTRSLSQPGALTTANNESQFGFHQVTSRTTDGGPRNEFCAVAVFPVSSQL